MSHAIFFRERFQNQIDNYSPIAVIGGAGYLGSHVCKNLEMESIPFWVVGRSDVYSGVYDYRHTAHSLCDALEGAKTVFHLASRTTPATGEKDPSLDIENIRFTMDLINASKKVGAKRIVYSSSGGTIYGNTDGKIATEETIPYPSCSYAIAKLASENYLRLASKDGELSTVILRISNLYGGVQQVKGDQGVIGYLLKNITSTDNVYLFGNTIRDYIYIEDVCRAFLLAAFSKIEHCDVINISSGSGTSLSELVDLISNILGKELDFIQRSRRPFDLEYNVLSNHKAKTVLGWAPLVSLKKGLTSCIQEHGFCVGAKEK